MTNVETRKRTRLSELVNPFIIGSIAGFIAIGVNFIFRLGGYVAFPPESAIEAVIKIIPESIQEPSVQALGDLAGELGLVVAVVVAIAVYGILGIVFEKAYAPRIAGTRRISRFEKFLLYSFVPWLLFGLVVFPLAGASLFGVGGIAGTTTQNWVFPLVFLLVQMVYGLGLAWQYGNSNVLIRKQTREVAVSSIARYNTKPKMVARREFIEKGVLTVGALGIAFLSLDQLLPSLLSSTSSGIPGGTSFTASGTPPIFSDPRLSSLVNSEVTSNDQFYRVAIDIFDPSVNASTWNLELTGLIGNQKQYTLGDLQNLPQTEEYSTFECVSNVVNGNLISNARWTGVKISDLFSDAGGAQSGASYVVF
ncbi:MAG TPA: molybdopterin-dependent oxidoreductase, partial [Nitrososphaerales archaeon]|nr:molybdopterin-dependent oxidoreductase [Nitrososphaerales archaeon]